MEAGGINKSSQRVNVGGVSDLIIVIITIIIIYKSVLALYGGVIATLTVNLSLLVLFEM